MGRACVEGLPLVLDDARAATADKCPFGGLPRAIGALAIVPVRSGGQTIGAYPGQGIGIGQPSTQPLQQIFQSLQTVPQQLQLLQQQLQQLQQLQYVQQQHLHQLLQVVPAQLQQLQQLVQFIPQQIQQLQQQPFGLPLGVTGGVFQPMSTINPFAGQGASVM